MPDYVREIEAVGVHGLFDFRLHFHPDVNIVFGRNGTGKTTLLHLLANILEGDYLRFAFLSFHSIRVGLGSGRRVILSRTEGEGEQNIRVKLNGDRIREFSVMEARELGRQNVRAQMRAHLRRHPLEEGRAEGLEELDPLVRTAYFPAFRTMIEAWAAMEERVRDVPSPRWRGQATQRARAWFGDFVPSVSFPSVLEIEDRLAGEIGRARLTISRADRRLLSEAFLDIFQALSEADREVGEQTEAVLGEIGELFERLSESPLKAESMLLTQVYPELRQLIGKFKVGEESESTAVRVLEVYREMLAEIVGVQERSFEEIQRYLSSVNEFLEDKTLVVDPGPPRPRGAAVGVKFQDDSYSSGLRALSSGERQIVTLMYAATHMSKQQVVLIDEPEISLHVDWQRRLVPKMAEQLGARQIIACTHSPVVGADYEDRVLELELAPTAEPVPDEEEQGDEEDVL
jgi:predicted ATPase